jgi:pre-mRNA-splicing helicase BRR2
LPLNLGIISSFYYINTTTIDFFFQNLKQDNKLRELIEILSNASEFEAVPIRHGEDKLLKQLAEQLNYKLEKVNFNEPNTKTILLL